MAGVLFVTSVLIFLIGLISEQITALPLWIVTSSIYSRQRLELLVESRPGNLTILMVASSYPRFEGDTASIFLRNLAQHVARTGVRVHVLAPSDAQVRHDMDEQDVKIHYFRYFPKCSQMLAYGSGILPNIRRHPWLVVQIPFFLLSMFFALLMQSRKNQPQIIHAHWIVPVGFVAVLVGKLLKIPVIVTAHGGDAFGLQGGLLRVLKNFTVKQSQAWTANTQQTARAAFELGRV